ncbi:MAG TPA: YceD family protein [Pseudomonadales bacterium]|nr:YceD family protein [Pseudomonadales bacterium]
MISHPLQKVIYPYKLAASGGEMAGDVALDQFHRLSGYLLDTDGKVEAKLEFGETEKGMPLVTGHIRAVVRRECVNCAHAVEEKIDFIPQIVIVKSEDEASELDESLDPVILTDEKIGLVDLIEDEIILALPILARHPEGQCDPSYYAWKAQQESQLKNAGVGKKENPFSVLAKLKQSKSEDTDH